MGLDTTHYWTDKQKYGQINKNIDRWKDKVKIVKGMKV